MASSRKTKVSVSLDRDLLAAIDRRVARGGTRSELIEAWLRLAALDEARRDLDAATVAYYEGRSAEQQAEDEGLSVFSKRSVSERGLDYTPRSRRRRA